MKTPKTDAFVANLRKMCKNAHKNERKSCDFSQKMAEKLVKSAKIRVFCNNLRDYAATVAEINAKTGKTSK